MFLSDHGYHLGEFGLWAKTSCFEFDARVPLIVSAPSMTTTGKATTETVALVDLFPTLSELCGLKQPKGLDDGSLARTITDGADGAKAVAFTQHPRPAYFDRTEKGVPDTMGYSA